MMTRDQAAETIEDAICELRGLHFQSDSAMTRNDLDNLIERLYSLQVMVEELPES